MRVDHALAEPGAIPAGSAVAATIGNFDGVHRGHRAILDRAAALAGEVAVVTFEPNPRCVLTPERCPATLTPLAEKARLLEAAGVERLVVLHFDLAMSRWRAAHFCERLLAHLDLAALVVGPDFAFGHNREGDVAYLRRFGTEHGVAIEVVEALDAGGAQVSSTRVRSALAEGDVAAAAALLGRPHSITGSVEDGEKLGRSLGFPTANLALAGNLALPARGVYAGWAQVRGGWHMAATSVGVRPTFGGRRLVVELHLLDFDDDVYGEELRCAFVARLREERSYPDAAALVEEMHRDVARTRHLLAEAPPPESQRRRE